MFSPMCDGMGLYWDLWDPLSFITVGNQKSPNYSRWRHNLSFQERDAYLPLAQNDSRLFFVINDLATIISIYKFSLAAFLRLFR